MSFEDDRKKRKNIIKKENNILTYINGQEVANSAVIINAQAP